MRYDISQKGKHCAKLNGMKKLIITEFHENNQTSFGYATPNIVTNFGVMIRCYVPQKLTAVC